jgi:hypothetical protein
MWVTELRRRLKAHFELGGVSVDEALRLGFDAQTIWKAVSSNQGIDSSFE